MGEYNATIPVSHALDALGYSHFSIIVRRKLLWATLKQPSLFAIGVLSPDPNGMPMWVSYLTLGQTPQTTEQEWWVPTALELPAATRVSRTLDIITKTPGAILVRENKFWNALEPITNTFGWVLGSNPSGVVQWMPTSDIPYWTIA